MFADDDEGGDDDDDITIRSQNLSQTTIKMSCVLHRRTLCVLSGRPNWYSIRRRYHSRQRQQFVFVCCCLVEDCVAIRIWVFVVLSRAATWDTTAPSTIRGEGIPPYAFVCLFAFGCDFASEWQLHTQSPLALYPLQSSFGFVLFSRIFPFRPILFSSLILGVRFWLFSFCSHLPSPVDAQSSTNPCHLYLAAAPHRPRPSSHWTRRRNKMKWKMFHVQFLLPSDTCKCWATVSNGELAWKSWANKCDGWRRCNQENQIRTHCIWCRPSSFHSRVCVLCVSTIWGVLCLCDTINLQ